MSKILDMQLLHAKGAPSIFTSHTNAYWRMVRKGVAPAFNPKHIRSPRTYNIQHVFFSWLEAVTISIMHWQIDDGCDCFAGRAFIMS